MQRAGWLSVGSMSGGRAKIARVTEAGRAIMAVAAPHWATAQAGFLDDIGRDAWLGIVSALERMVSVAAAHS